MKQVLFFILSTLIFQTASASEITNFKVDWCSHNQYQFSQIQWLCYGQAQFDPHGSIRALALQNKDGVSNLFIESDFTTIDMFNLDTTIIGPVASSHPHEEFAAKYMGQMKLEVDEDGEVFSVEGSLQSGEQFSAERSY